MDNQKAQPLPGPAPDSNNSRLIPAKEVYQRLCISRSKFYKDRDSWILDPLVNKRGTTLWLEREFVRWVEAGTPDREAWRELRKQWKDLPASSQLAGPSPSKRPRRRPPRSAQTKPASSIAPGLPVSPEPPPGGAGSESDPSAAPAPLAGGSSAAHCPRCGDVLAGEFCPRCGLRQCASCGQP